MTRRCSICAGCDVSAVNELLQLGQSAREIEKRFPEVGRGAVGRHRMQCLGIADPHAKSARTNASRRTSRRLAAVKAVTPIETAQDVIEDLQRLRVEAYGLFESAKARADWKSAERIFSQVVAVVDRFGEMHRVLGAKGSVTITVDARTMIAGRLAKLSDDDLRALARGGATTLAGDVIGDTYEGDAA